MAEQLTFDWPMGVALGAADFFVSDANTQAYAMLQAPQTWPERKLIVTGAKGAGKSHLARVFATQMDATHLSATTLLDALSDALPDAGANIVVEDMDQLPPIANEFMFHLHNHLRNTGGHLLMTARTPPGRWPLTLPDLASRMQATTLIAIDNPDDALLAALIMKLLADRQIMPPISLVNYLVPRIERSFAAAAQVVARLDAASMAQGRPINRALAAGLLDKADH
ncbi:P-loop NTPase family protein [Yoonia sp. MH D7]